MDMNNLDNIDSIVYYQKRQFAKVVKNHINQEYEDIKQLSDEFDDQYNRDLKYAVLYSERYTEKLDANYLIFFNGIIIDNSEFKDKSCYKYYSTSALIENKYGTSDGYVSLTNPYLFNDPFAEKSAIRIGNSKDNVTVGNVNGHGGSDLKKNGHCRSGIQECKCLDCGRDFAL